ncbi:MAG: histidyl-tRNA synthetase [Candidatus Saccharibacteria bacterium]|nr:histidyl-tRNA synthetase [Candidatus Saccharibacteria bacterium]
MALSTQPYKGARDFYPEDKRLQKYLFGVMRKAVEKYGYEEYDAPILEPLELYQAKTGEEIVNEQTYTFTDRGQRQVAIRPEMTPTVSRMVAARRQDLAYPLRWYSIPNLWRYERPQRGRLREHWQLNVDIFGVADLGAEQEIIEVADYILQTFKAKRDMYTIKLNSRQLVDAMTQDYLKLSEVEAFTLSKLIDRMHKMEPGEFIAQAEAILSPSERESGLSDKFQALLQSKTLEDLPAELQQHASVEELRKLITALTNSGITNVEFDITLMRGFDYYTDIVFEVFDNHPENNRSLFGGGRYDGLVSLFGVEPVPTVGFGMGDVTLQNFLESHNLMPQLYSETDVYVVIIGEIYAQAQPAIKKLREMGLKVAVGIGDSKIDKQIKTAVKKGLHYAIFIGENELNNESFVLKNLEGQTEEKHSLERIVSIIKDHRKNR